MFRKILLIIVLFWLASYNYSYSDDLTYWEEQYGPKLVNIPFGIQQQYLMANNQDWYDATPEEQYAFLYQLDGEKKSRLLLLEQKIERKKLEDLMRASKEESRKEALNSKIEARKAKEAAAKDEHDRKKNKLESIVQRRQDMMKAIRDRNRHK
ncbi:MAG: hypothetical protein HGA80_04495 [Candidatus Omnitrophica bacterium]|nr:hypothetical protein [Candidatus Omnitrophota bacterium]